MVLSPAGMGFLVRWNITMFEYSQLLLVRSCHAYLCAALLPSLHTSMKLLTKKYIV